MKTPGFLQPCVKSVNRPFKVGGLPAQCVPDPDAEGGTEEAEAEAGPGTRANCMSKKSCPIFKVYYKILRAYWTYGMFITLNRGQFGHVLSRQFS